jgi:hypothetical protein
MKEQENFRFLVEFKENIIKVDFFPIVHVFRPNLKRKPIENTQSCFITSHIQQS